MEAPGISSEDKKKLDNQESRGLVSEFLQNKLEREAKANWDKFYKRNEERFFKDRNWTTREFEELSSGLDKCSLLEVGCGVGNFIFPLCDKRKFNKFFACDFSPRAINLLKNNKLFDPSVINAFVCDLTKNELVPAMEGKTVDFISMVFVLSAILPCNFGYVLRDLFEVLNPGGSLLFRDYGLYDMAMIRFGPGAKMADKLYVRQDGTRSYFFDVEELRSLFLDCGFEIIELDYVHRQTVNKKEGIDVKRTFVQARCRKPLNSRLF